MNKATRKKEHRTKLRRNDSAQESNNSPALLFQNISKAVLITVGVGLLMVLSMALIAYFCPDPDSMTRPLGLAASALTALVGGFTAVRLHGHNALVCGLLSGSALTVLLLLISLFFTTYASGYSAGISCLLHTAFVLFSVAGAYLGLPRASKTKSKKMHGRR